MTVKFTKENFSLLVEGLLHEKSWLNIFQVNRAIGLNQEQNIGVNRNVGTLIKNL